MDHQAQIIRLECVEPADMVGSNIHWRRVDWDDLAERLEIDMAGRSRCMEWEGLRRGVDDIKHAPQRRKMPGWWMAELCRLRVDVRRFRAAGRHEECVSQEGVQG